MAATKASKRNWVNKLLLTPFVAFAWLGHTQATTVEVPQGSGVFPTIGQVECLEELGSGRLCAATYECSGGGSGELWGDMANHDGRRPIGATSTVAHGRSCVVTVDGAAAVRWYSGYRPAGRTGELVGLTTLSDALRPVQRVERSAIADGGPLLPYLLERYDTTLVELADEKCGHIQEGHPEQTSCVSGVLGSAVEILDLRETEYTRCLVDGIAEINFNLLDLLTFGREPFLLSNADPRGGYSAEGEFGVDNCVPMARQILAEHEIEMIDGAFALHE